MAKNWKQFTAEKNLIVFDQNCCNLPTSSIKDVKATGEAFSR
jgi:hypothetical protein